MDSEGHGDRVNTTTAVEAAGPKGHPEALDELSAPRAEEPQDHATPVAPLTEPVPDPEAQITAALDAGRHNEALELCARRYGALLGRLGMVLLGAQADAEEVAQEALLIAHRDWADYQRRGSIRAWLFGIARKLCLKRLTQRERRQRRLTLLVSEEQQLPDEVLVARQRATNARQLLERVRPTDREALVLRYVAELTYAEIAVGCDIDEATARKRVSRALSRVRELLDPET